MSDKRRERKKVFFFFSSTGSDSVCICQNPLYEVFYSSNEVKVALTKEEKERRTMRVNGRSYQKLFSSFLFAVVFLWS